MAGVARVGVIMQILREADVPERFVVRIREELESLIDEVY